MEHKDIPDSQLHEIKGAASATAKQVPKATGTGGTAFGFIDWSEVVNKPTATGYQRILQAYSSTSQAPTAVDTPYDVLFGGAQTLADVSISSAGVLTFNTAGAYQVTQFLRFGRSTSTGNAIILSRLLYNGSQSLNSNAAVVVSSSSIIPFSTTLSFIAAAGDTIKVQIMRDSAGTNDGGLVALTPVVSSWNIVPSATVLVSKFVGGV